MPKWTGPEIINCAHTNPNLLKPDWFDPYPEPSEMSFKVETHNLPVLVRINKNNLDFTRTFLFRYEGQPFEFHVSEQLIGGLYYTPFEKQLAYFIARGVGKSLNILCTEAINALATHLKIYLEDLKKEKIDQLIYTKPSHSISKISRSLPGMEYIPSTEDKTKTGCTGTHAVHPVSLWNFIQHLNDKHKMSREKIADWLDELHDSGKINLEFEPWKEPTNVTDSPAED